MRTILTFYHPLFGLVASWYSCVPLCAFFAYYLLPATPNLHFARLSALLIGDGFAWPRLAFGLRLGFGVEIRESGLIFSASGR